VIPNSPGNGLAFTRRRDITVGTWTARTALRADPDRVLDLLTDPDAAGLWSPLEFAVEEIDGDRLRAGGRAVLSGRLAGRWVEFELDVHEADDSRLSLQARGPVTMDVTYEVLDTQILARVRVHGGRGLTGRLLSSAVDGVLAAGTLQVAVDAIAREAESGELALAA
jgi:hypothetical protein